MIEIIDIGASPLEGPAPYEHLVALGLARVTGFEPDPDAFAALKHDRNHHWLPQAVADGRTRTFYRYKASVLNSLLPLRSDLSKVFPEAKDWMQSTGDAEISTKRLDDLQLPCDYLKMDCQGAELLVLQNARQTLLGCVLIQLEINFTPIYIGQPVLCNLDSELRSQGFQPRNIISSHVAATGAIIDADFLYVRKEPTEAQGRRAAQILESCYPKCYR